MNLTSWTKTPQACASSLARMLRGLALSTAVFTAAALGAPAPWPDSPYSHFANNTPLETVLAEFASGFSLSLAMQPGLGGASVNGRFTTRNPTEFISRLGGVYGFTWFTHAGTLHVSRASDMVTRSLPVPGSSQAQWRQALTDLGVLEPRFGWGELPDQGVVLVSGPPAYVGLVEATLRQLPASATAQQVLVFRLRHASAEDRLIQYRDRQVRQAGLATVLRNLVAVGSGGAAGGGGLTESLLPSPGGLRPAGAAGDGASGAVTQAAPSASPAEASPPRAATTPVVGPVQGPRGGGRDTHPGSGIDPVGSTPERAGDP